MADDDKSRAAVSCDRSAATAAAVNAALGDEFPQPFRPCYRPGAIGGRGGVPARATPAGRSTPLRVSYPVFPPPRRRRDAFISRPIIMRARGARTHCCCYCCRRRCCWLLLLLSDRRRRVFDVRAIGLKSCTYISSFLRRTAESAARTGDSSSALLGHRSSDACLLAVNYFCFLFCLSRLTTFAPDVVMCTSILA